MGPTGSGKSKLAIDLAAHFPVEVINADSMQVYSGLGILTNKVPLHDQKGLPHHLLGTVSPNVEFTAKEFRDSAILLMDEILSQNCLPVIVGETNYYIQALVSSFLLDDTAQDLDECISGDDQAVHMLESARDTFDFTYEFLKNIDPVAANRLHPNNHRKIKQYLHLYARTGIIPSKLYQGKAAQKRRLSRLQILFGWNMHHVATDPISNDSWATQVVAPAVKIIRSFLNEGRSSVLEQEVHIDVGTELVERNLWT